jgi:hypothetical protein
MGRAFGALLGSNLQSLFPVETVDPLGVYLPALASQQHGQPPITVANSGGGKLPQTHTQIELRITATLVAVDPTGNPGEPTGPPFAEIISLAHLPHQFAPDGGPQTFFDKTSCRMCLSKVRSATSVFNFRFSSRS